MAVSRAISIWTLLILLAAPIGTAPDAAAQSEVPIPPEHPRRSQDAFLSGVPVPPRLNAPETASTSSPVLQSAAPVRALQEPAPPQAASAEPRLPAPARIEVVRPSEPAMALAPPMAPPSTKQDKMPVEPTPAVQPVKEEAVTEIRKAVAASTGPSLPTPAAPVAARPSEPAMARAPSMVPPSTKQDKLPVEPAPSVQPATEQPVTEFRETVAASVEPRLPAPTAPVAARPYEPAMALAPSTVPLPPKRNTVLVEPPPAVKPVAEGPVTEIRKEVKALFDNRISAGDKRRLKAAFNDFRRKRYSSALAARDGIDDPAARKLITWYYLRSGALGAHPINVVRFLDDNPDWPNRDLMRRRGEFILLQQSWPSETVMEFFQGGKPTTGAGKAALGGALIDSGQDEKGKALVREAWRQHELGKAAEDKLLKRFGHLLSKADHKERADRLLYAERKRLLSSALRAASKVGKSEHNKAKARAAVTRRAGNASSLYKALPKDAKADPGVRFNRIQYLRRKKKDEAARAMLLAAPSDPAKLVDLEAWWVERRIHCRRALNEGKPKLAYRIANDYDRLTGRYHAQATFLAGWIALRFLNDPEAAKTHFEALKSQATLDRTIARAHYWLGRTEAELGNDEASETHYREAGKQTRTYYGQLALQMLERPSLRFAAPAVPTEDEVKRFAGRDAVRALLIADQAGLDHLFSRFLGQLAYRVETPGEAAMLAELARKLSTQQRALRVSKVMLRRGLPVEHYGYPAGVLPKYRKLNGGAERALLYALARQESEFNTKAKSPVGARGLMQIMPGTARMIARDHKLRYSRSKLISDPSYNMTLGAAHIRDLLDDWRGSYILMLVSYNAGPGRARDWIESYGDPRDPNVDPVDWVERIPFTETRNYVLKIMASIQVYRSRLEGPRGTLRLAQDLRRGQPGGKADRRASVRFTD